MPFLLEKRITTGSQIYYIFWKSSFIHPDITVVRHLTTPILTEAPCARHDKAYLHNVQLNERTKLPKRQNEGSRCLAPGCPTIWILININVNILRMQVIKYCPSPRYAYTVNLEVAIFYIPAFPGRLDITSRLQNTIHVYIILGNSLMFTKHSYTHNKSRRFHNWHNQDSTSDMPKKYKM